MKIPYNDLHHLHKKNQKHFLNDLKKSINKSQFVNTDEVKDFERLFSIYLNSKFSIGCANGSDALYLALNCIFGSSKFNIVIPTISFISTMIAPMRLNAKIFFCDIDVKTGLIDLIKLKKILDTKKIDSVISVDFNGSTPDYQHLSKLKRKYKFKLVIDAAQSLGSYHCSFCKSNYKKTVCCRKGPKYSTVADISTYSFYPGKNLGALGDGGMIATNLKKYANKIKTLRNNGFNGTKIKTLGINSRLDSIQASFLKTKIKSLDKENFERSNKYRFYLQNLVINEKKGLIVKHSKGSNYHIFAILIFNEKDRKKLINKLKKNEVNFNSHYKYSLPEAYNLLNKDKKNLKNYKSINYAKYCLSLPLYPSLDVKKIIKICNLINSVLSK